MLCVDAVEGDIAGQVLLNTTYCTRSTIQVLCVSSDSPSVKVRLENLRAKDVVRSSDVESVLLKEGNLVGSGCAQTCGYA